MKKIGFIILAVIFIHSSFAMAKRKRVPKAYSFIVEAGKASQGECDGEGKIPRRLKTQKEFSAGKSYLGSELQEQELKSKTNDEMWKHFYRDKSTCNSVLAKTPSTLDEAEKEKKPELPPEEAVEGDEEADEAP